MKNIILTGDRPTGRLHLGHYVGSLKRRVELQNSGRFDEINILIADDQALTDNADNPGKIRENIINVVLDYLSVGIDPTKSTICVQSTLPALHALTFYYMNLVTTARLSRNPTVKSEIQMRGFARSSAFAKGLVRPSTWKRRVTRVGMFRSRCLSARSLTTRSRTAGRRSRGAR